MAISSIRDTITGDILPLSTVLTNTDNRRALLTELAIKSSLAKRSVNEDRKSPLRVHLQLQSVRSTSLLRTQSQLADRKSLSPEIVEAARKRQEAHRRRATARRSKSAPRPEEPEVMAAIARKPTRPAPLSCRRVRAAMSAPTPLPKTTVNTPSKRRVEMTPSAL